MHKYFKNILLFFIPIVLIGFTLEVLLRNIPNVYSHKNSYLEKNVTEIQTLILGSSHTLYGINPEYIDGNAFNASHVSQSLDFDLDIFKRYEDNFTSLEKIMIRVSYSTMYSTLTVTPEIWRVKDYVIYYDIENKHSPRYYFELFSMKFRNNISKLIKYYVKNSNDINLSESGWGTDYNSKNSKNLKKTGKEASERHLGNVKYLESNLLILKELIERCKKRNIEVVLITLPAHNEYRKNINHIQLSAIFKYAQNLEDEYENCTYINLFDNKNFLDSEFYDADHLNEIGAKKLSLMLNKYKYLK